MNCNKLHNAVRLLIKEMTMHENQLILLSKSFAVDIILICGAFKVCFFALFGANACLLKAAVIQ